MNVGELRRALENVSDTREVCFTAGDGMLRLYRSATSAETCKMMPLSDGFYYHSIEQTSLDRLVFVVK